jgi:hypothetical protein
MTVPRFPLAVALLAAALLAVFSSAGSAFATPGKSYTLDLSPSSVAAGARVTFTATFAVPADQQQQLGSADLTAPSGLTLVSASVAAPATATRSGNTVKLRDMSLQPGAAPLVVTLVADAACSASSGSWTVAGKQANSFKGEPGNDLTRDPGVGSLAASVTGSCALRFVTQPANARVGEAITGTAYTPTGPGVSVETINGAGDRVTTSGTPITMAIGAASGLGTLSGTKTVNTASGVATFSDLSINAPGTYTLSASASGFSSVSSNAFRIESVAIACTEDTPCTGSLGDGTTKVNVTASPDATQTDSGVLTLSFGGGAALDCAGYTEFSPDTAAINFTSDTRTKTVTETIDKKQMNLVPNNGATSLNVCFGSPQPFTTAGGGTAPVQGSYDWDGNGTLDPVYVGVLPNCGARPCVSKRNKTGAGDGVITSLLPAGLGDPWHRA